MVGNKLIGKRECFAFFRILIILSRVWKHRENQKKLGDNQLGGKTWVLQKFKY